MWRWVVGAAAKVGICATSLDRCSDLNSAVRQVGTHYIAVGEHAELWNGELVEANSTLKVAIKLLRQRSRTSPYSRANLEKALDDRGRVWKTLRHENIARFHGFASNFGTLPALIIDFYPNGNINDFAKKHFLEDNVKLSLIADIALGLKYLHELKPPVIHGDIRGVNVLINADGQAALADYNLVSVTASRDFTSTVSPRACRWTAPEVMESDHDRTNALSPYSSASDMFSFAMTVVEIITQSPPFPKIKTCGSIITAILDGKRPEIPPFIRRQKELAGLIPKCWDESPKARPSADEICQGLVKIPPM